MKIAVIGLWHLGLVTAGCLASEGFEVIAYDSSEETIDNLLQGRLPIFEPDLPEMLVASQENKKLIFTFDKEALREADFLWLTIDTPIDENDNADIDYVLSEIISALPYVKNGASIIISSQLPVGTTRKLQQIANQRYAHKNLTFAYTPENLRLGKAVQVFLHPERIVIGIDERINKEQLTKIFSPFSENLLWMSLESAEMTKHAINAFLANSVIFINEIASLCERLGASAHEVELGMKTENRIGPNAYLRPGNAIGGGTLLRDINYLISLAEEQGFSTELFPALIRSNNHHKRWAQDKILHLLGNLHNKNIAVLGLAYKEGTNSLRRSAAIEMCEWLKVQGVKICAYDPLIPNLPAEYSDLVNLAKSLPDAVQQVDAIFIATPHQEFHQLKSVISSSPTKTKHLIIDPPGAFKNLLQSEPNIDYFSVGNET